jgi:hypothetical protein
VNLELDNRIRRAVQTVDDAELGALAAHVESQAQAQCDAALAALELDARNIAVTVSVRLTFDATIDVDELEPDDEVEP